MRTRNVLAGLVALLSMRSAQAQIPDYFADSPVWTFSSMCAVPYPCILNTDYNYLPIGDSTVGNITYHKMYRSGIGTYEYFGGPPVPQSCTGSFTFTDPVPFFLLRQQGRRFYTWNGMADTLLYDFDLQVGDYLPLTHNNNWTDIMISAVDNISVGGSMRKRFTLSGSYSGYLYEGIGFTGGLIEPVPPILECGYTLECFGLGDVSYVPTVGPTCLLAVGIDQAPAAPQLSIGPNPTQGPVTIRDATAGPATITDAMGRNVATLQLKGGTEHLMLETMPQGMYTLRTADGRAVRLVIH